MKALAKAAQVVHAETGGAEEQSCSWLQEARQEGLFRARAARLVHLRSHEMVIADTLPPVISSLNPKRGMLTLMESRHCRSFSELQRFCHVSVQTLSIDALW